MSADDRKTFDPRALRNAFSAFMTGVTVVTAHDREGRPIGFTANSFASVSLDPPLLLVCLARSSRNFENLTKSKRFAINILAEHQKDLSNTFARPSEDRFAQVDWRNGPHGSPIFADVCAWFDCSQHRIVEGGDHVILIGRVEAFENGVANGLGYARGGYFTPALTEQALSAASQDADLVVSAVVEHGGAVLLLEDAKGSLSLPECPVGATSPLQYLGGALGLEIEVGFVFSVFSETGTARQHIVYRCSSGEGTPRKGRSFSLDDLPLARVASKAQANILQRFTQESRLGNFGIYLGNEASGRILPLAQNGDA